MAALVTQNLVDAGTAPTPVDASTSDTFEIGNGHNTFLFYTNGDEASHTITIDVPGDTDYGQDTPNPEFTVAAGDSVWIPVRKAFASTDDASRGVVTIASAATSVTVAVVRLS